LADGSTVTGSPLKGMEPFSGKSSEHRRSVD
jgi:hypothetical protein